MSSSRRHDWRALRQRTHATLSPRQALPKKQNKRAPGSGIAGDESAHCNNEDHCEKLRPPNTTAPGLEAAASSNRDLDPNEDIEGEQHVADDQPVASRAEMVPRVLARTCYTARAGSGTGAHTGRTLQAPAAPNDRVARARNRSL